MVDPVQRTARIEPGLTWGEVAHTLHPFGLAMTSGNVALVGVGGLLLGGGIGWMARSEGLTIDHLRAVELVTADGQLLRASADEHPDLFWGVRGGGGNFGVATTFEFDLHRGGAVLGGAVFYEATEAERLLKEYVRVAATAPEELTTDITFMQAPPVPFIPADKHGTPVAAVMLVYNGDPAAGEQVVAPLRRLATPLVDTVAPMPYPDIFQLVAVGEVRDWQHHGRSQFFPELSDGMLDALADATRAVMSPETIVNLRVLGGAMRRVANDATAFAHRNAQGLILVTHFGPPVLDPARLDAGSQQVFEALVPYASGVYVNFLGDEGEQRIREAYPLPTYERLVALKNRYDPTNLFRGNQTIKPTM
jgi:FAD/FMN-containing dehydrogenase